MKRPPRPIGIDCTDLLIFSRASSCSLPVAAAGLIQSFEMLNRKWSQWKHQGFLNKSFCCMPFYDKMVEREDRHAQSPPSIVSETLSSLCKMSSVAGLWKGHSSAQRLTEGSGTSYVMYARIRRCLLQVSSADFPWTSVSLDRIINIYAIGFQT